MPNRSIRSPFEKAHLGDEIRFEPMSFAQAGVFRYQRESGCFARVWIKPLPDICSLFEREASTDATCIPIDSLRRGLESKRQSLEVPSQNRCTQR